MLIKRLNLQLISSTLCLSLLAACSIYKPQIAQGNIVTAAQLASLKVGMNRQQVQQALGSPLLQDVFNATRWDYVYRTLSGKGVLEQRVLTVFFNADNTVNRWTGQEAPNLNPLNTNTIAVAAPSSSPASTLAAAPLAAKPLSSEITNLGVNAPVIAIVPPSKDVSLPAAPILLAAPALAVPTSTRSAPLVNTVAAQQQPAQTVQTITALAEDSFNAEIKARIETWRSAWESKDLNRYEAHYASDFKGETANSAAWLASRKRIIDDAGVIVLKVSNFNVIQTANDEARASFMQSYQSRRLTETGEKSLFFKRLGNEWKIVSERFIKQN